MQDAIKRTTFTGHFSCKIYELNPEEKEEEELHYLEITYSYEFWEDSCAVWDYSRGVGTAPERGGANFLTWEEIIEPAFGLSIPLTEILLFTTATHFRECCQKDLEQRIENNEDLTAENWEPDFDCIKDER